MSETMKALADQWRCPHRGNRYPARQLADKDREIAALRAALEVALNKVKATKKRRIDAALSA